MLPTYHRQLHPIRDKHSKPEQHARPPISLEYDLVLRPRYPIYQKRELHGGKTVSRGALRRQAARERAMRQAVPEQGTQSTNDTHNTQNTQDGVSLASQTTGSSSTENEPDPELRGGNVSPRQMCPENQPLLQPGTTVELPLRLAVPRRIAKLGRGGRPGWRRQSITHLTGNGQRRPDKPTLWENPGPDADPDPDLDANTNYTLASGSPTTPLHDAQTPWDAAQPRATAWRRCLPPWEVPVLSRMTF